MRRISTSLPWLWVATTTRLVCSMIDPPYAFAVRNRQGRQPRLGTGESAATGGRFRQCPSTLELNHYRHQFAASAASWAAWSSLFPLAASSSSVSSSALLKGRCSAVPCISMKSPEPVMATFMSVMAWLSSM